jgi:hypothetical protein
MELKNTDATCYICAAVYFNEDFCNQIIKEIFEEEHKVIAKSYGVDLSTIVKNCLAAREIRDVRNLKLALLLLITLISAIIAKNILVVIFFYPIAYLIVYSEFYRIRYNLVAKHFLKKSFNSKSIKFKSNPSVENRLQELANEQEGNIIIYGEFSPFVGSGEYINGWSFTININKGKKEGEKVVIPLAFDLNEIHTYINDSINKLNLDNLTLEDNLHINGQEIRDKNNFLPDPLKRPVTLVESQLIRDFMEKPTHTIRHYKSIRVTDWNGELILSIFLRFVKVGQNLFIEASYYLLTPLGKYYRQFDNLLPEPTSEQSRELVLESIFKAISLWLLSPFAVFSRFNRYRVNQRQYYINRRNIEANPAFNYGATDSLRERVSYPEYRRYFQKLDQDMYLKIIERQIIDNIKNFLESKKIDTSDFEDARSTILNYGVVVSGGSIEAKNFAVGKNAKSVDLGSIPISQKDGRE